MATHVKLGFTVFALGFICGCAMAPQTAEVPLQGAEGQATPPRNVRPDGPANPDGDARGIAEGQRGNQSLSDSNQRSGADALRKCDQRLGSAVIMDVHGASPQEAANYYQLQLPPLSKIAEHVSKTLNCFDVLLNDPTMDMLPGATRATQPDFILRVRPVEVKMSVDMGSIARKAATGVLGTFLGLGMMSPFGGLGTAVGGGVVQGSQAQARGPIDKQVDSVTVAIEVACPKQRRIAAEFTGTETPAALDDKRYLFAWPENKVNLNQELVARAYLKAHTDLVSLLSARKDPCAESVRTGSL